MHHLICFESDQYLPPTKYRLLSVLPHVAVPQPSEKIFRIDFNESTNEVHIKWQGTLPNKCKLCDFEIRYIKLANTRVFLNFSSNRSRSIN